MKRSYFAKMYPYMIPFLVYVFTIPFIGNDYILVARIVILVGLLFYYRKYYKFKLEMDFFAVLIGIVIFLLWIFLEGHYPLLGTTSYVPTSNLALFSRLFSFIIIAPVIEEFFVRNFLARIIISEHWEKVKLGTFTILSFTVTMLFFGFSHNRWLPGLIAGALLNYVVYKRKSMGSLIVAHSTANILLAVYILYTGSWLLW